jgi:hypothetical protein
VAGCRREPVAIGSQFGSQILSTPLVSECLNTASVTAVASAWRYVWLKRLQAALLGRFGLGSGPTLVGQRFSAARTGPTSELVFLFGAGLSGAVSERQFADQVEPDEAAMVGPKQARRNHKFDPAANLCSNTRRRLRSLWRQHSMGSPRLSGFRVLPASLACRAETVIPVSGSVAVCSG